MNRSTALGAVGCLIMILFISYAILQLAAGQWFGFAAQMAVAATAVAVCLGVRLRRELRRASALARLCTDAYEANQRMIELDLVEPLLDDVDLLMARADAKVRRDTELAQRYANGDSSDY